MLSLPSFGILAKAFKDFFDIIFKIGEYEQAQREKKFKEVILPVYQTFNTIHAEYIKIIDFCIAALPLKDESTIDIPEIEGVTKSDPQKIYFMSDNTIDDYNKRIIFIKDFIEKERNKNDYNRIEVRSKSAAILLTADNLLEKRFLVSLFNYFLDFTTPMLDDNDLDSWISKLLEDNGVDKYTHTPSYVIRETISPLTDDEQIRTVLQEARSRLNDYYPQVSFCLTKIQTDLLNVA
ncbi:hypothetical protein AHMF7605_01980 [Adhaeribacter arboris]|uniref:Uncharacterized protein n=1 Tax=Adhaeribacter arboris TaxID=2072846 RepID=A0A2T2YAA9_9BACT|nr:hypothetical protein [Adhaeribacter arboris]PSR52378.1 hypothetical protein AHMF7605_01980 [Adhaeribacter arboris]